jgi:hypothetical protein
MCFSFQLSPKPTGVRMDLPIACFAGRHPPHHIACHDANRLPLPIRWKSQNPLKGRGIIDCRSPWREAANGRGGAAVSRLTGANTEHLKRIANSAIAAGTLRVEERIEQSLGGGNAAWIDGI